MEKMFYADGEKILHRQRKCPLQTTTLTNKICHEDEEKILLMGMNCSLQIENHVRLVQTMLDNMHSMRNFSEEYVLYRQRKYSLQMQNESFINKYVL